MAPTAFAWYLSTVRFERRPLKCFSDLGLFCVGCVSSSWLYFLFFFLAFFFATFFLVFFFAFFFATFFFVAFFLFAICHLLPVLALRSELVAT